MPDCLAHIYVLQATNKTEVIYGAAILQDFPIKPEKLVPAMFNSNSNIINVPNRWNSVFANFSKQNKDMCDRDKYF